MVGSGPEDRVVCPVCGLPGRPIMYGHPNERGAAKAPAGRIVLGGCVILPRTADYMCPRFHGWRTGAPPPAGPESPELAASRRYAAGDLDGAERAYRELLDASIVERGERDPNTRALRHTLAIVLATAGRADEAAAAYAPLRPPSTDEEIAARIEERYRRAGLSWQPPQR
ncbi:hypothetical protein GCM10009557_02230 [Virgisporangium ochraceum]|uniref:Tetratricopeptide repeat protein n=1 Tax=Virgisporangium ochraceum TaxID=65505 RepID=A0A8J4EI40_9ACTN|nr:hypothetical protein [Virgisporangium ochraceum]GIJ72852.1 hypothetical protein Voc01_077690 [Virgisporangium ochraceum]